MTHSGEDRSRDIARAVRDACLEAARRGYEEAALSGLCEQGRIEMALDAIRALEPEELLERAGPGGHSDRAKKTP